MNLNEYKLDFKDHSQRTPKRISKQSVLISLNHYAKLLKKKYVQKMKSFWRYSMKNNQKT